MKKNDYLKPCTEIVLLTMHNNLLTTSGVEVYKDTETYEDDEQYSRQNNFNLWADDEEEENDGHLQW